VNPRKILDESDIIVIHPSGRVFTLRKKTLIELNLNPRAIVNATLDEHGVIDADGLEPKPVSKIGNRRQPEHDFFEKMPL
jgi:hypothetical protein